MHFELAVKMTPAEVRGLVSGLRRQDLVLSRLA
jgi:hypothetical protein